MVLDFLAIAVLFGPLPVAYFTYSESEPYVPFGFFIAYSVGAVALGLFHVVLAFLLVPVAWYLALKPIFTPR